jgi:hypothetical protein
MIVGSSVGAVNGAWLAASAFTATKPAHSPRPSSGHPACPTVPPVQGGAASVAIQIRRPDLVDVIIALGGTGAAAGLPRGSRAQGTSAAALFGLGAGVHALRRRRDRGRAAGPLLWRYLRRVSASAPRPAGPRQDGAGAGAVSPR